MSFADRLRQEITRYTPDDRGSLREYQREVFGAQARQLDEQHFEWLFDRNPFRPAEGPQIWVCRKEGKVVGQQAGIPFELKVGSEYYRASWAIDLMVHPQWRLRGVGPALSEAYTASNVITVGTGITDAAYRTFLRAGWIDRGFIPLYVRPLDVRRMLRGRSSATRLMDLAVRAGDPLVGLANMANDAYARYRGCVVQLVERFDERVDELWDAVSGCYAAIARRDFRSLQWRFDTLPKRECYHRLYLLNERVLRGYAVVRLSTWHGVPSGFVVDCLSAPEWLRPLFARCVEYLRTAGAAVVYCTMLCQKADACLCTLGFIRRPSGVRFMIRLRDAEGPVARVIADTRNWFITRADGDGDHVDIAHQ